MSLAEDMPSFARHEGVWKGEYRHFDATGKQVDSHRSTLICRFPEGGPFAYHQTNIYEWEDGRTEVHELPARHADGELHWETPQLRGTATELQLDDHGQTMMLYWQGVADPDLYLYEMIHFSRDGRKRSRSWHWIRGGELVRRTAIDEKLSTRDWRAADEEMKRRAA